MRTRFALAAALPALVSLAAMAVLADRLVRGALEDELAARLVAAAQSAAAIIPADRLMRLKPGDEDTRAYGYLRSRLEGLAGATGTRLFVIRPDRTALADSAGRTRIGGPVPVLERDRLEIALAASGRAVASQELFEGADGLLYKTGYAPVQDGAGRVVAVVGADGTASSFTTYRRFRRLFVLLALAGAVLGATVAAGASLSVTRPLTRLTVEARRIGRGDLTTPLAPRAGRRDEIGTLRDTLEEMRRALHARDEERETLLAGIAHEVRNPLGALDLFAGLLAEEVAGRPEAAHVIRIRTELSALEKVVREFLEYARSRSPAREVVELSSLLADVAELCEPLAAERGVRIACAGAGTARADREQLRRAVLNLTRNALEAAPEGSAVTLSASGGDTAVIEVRDRGPGLPAEARASLFRPFFTTKEKGTGLGLALAKKVADAHGGTLTLGDAGGGGTLARLTVPA